MRVKPFLAGGALFLSLVATGSAKSWDIVMASATKAGSTTLPAGYYTLKLKGANEAIFTAAGSGKQFTLPVKIEQAPQKFDSTAVETAKQGTGQVIQSIDLGGTTDKLEFGE